MDVDGAAASDDAPNGVPASEELPAAPQPSTSQPAATQPAAATVQGAAAQPESSDAAAAAADAAGPAQNGMAEGPAVDFVPGTVLQFDLEPDQVADNKSLNFRAIRPVFGGKEGGVRHCQYDHVSSCLSASSCWHALCTYVVMSCFYVHACRQHAAFASLGMAV